MYIARNHKIWSLDAVKIPLLISTYALWQMKLNRGPDWYWQNWQHWVFVLKVFDWLKTLNADFCRWSWKPLHQWLLNYCVFCDDGEIFQSLQQTEYTRQQMILNVIEQAMAVENVLNYCEHFHHFVVTWQFLRQSEMVPGADRDTNDENLSQIVLRVYFKWQIKDSSCLMESYYFPNWIPIQYVSWSNYFANIHGVAFLNWQNNMSSEFGPIASVIEKNYLTAKLNNNTFL